MTSDKNCLADEGEVESVRSDEEELNNLELWTEEAIDIETPFTTVAQDDIEYLKLEITELKQILISLAEKYKLSEDRRKVAERRNSFLKADNLRLQQMSDCSLSQKIEAELENRRTLDKLREFIDFKREFERQAELLKKIISHLPRMKNASTSCSLYSGTNDFYEIKPVHNNINNNNHTNYSNSLPIITQCSGDNNDNIKNESSIIKEITTIDDNKIVIDEYTETNFNDSDDVSKDLAIVDIKNDEKQNENVRDKIHQENRCDVIHQNYIDFNDGVTKIWNPKNPKEENNTAWIGGIRTTKSRVNLTKLKQEVLALKNMNNWKTSDLEFKSRQLVVKNRELSEAKKEITQLKMQVNKLILDQQKRVSSHHYLSHNSKLDLLQQSKSKIRQEQHSPKKRTSSREAKRNKSQHQVSTAINKNEAKRNKSLHRVASASLTKIENNNNNNSSSSSNKLPVSNESVWKEIAPGDQVRIKVKRQVPG